MQILLEIVAAYVFALSGFRAMERFTGADAHHARCRFITGSTVCCSTCLSTCLTDGFLMSAVITALAATMIWMLPDSLCWFMHVPGVSRRGGGGDLRALAGGGRQLSTEALRADAQDDARSRGAARRARAGGPLPRSR